MKKIITIPTVIGIFFLLAGIAVGIILISGRQVFKIGATQEAVPKDVRVSNITDSSFTVTWITDTPVLSFIKVGENQNFLDRTSNDEVSPTGITHSTTIKNLKPQSTYFFKIVSAGQEYDSSGVPWKASTGNTLTAPEVSINIQGTVENKDKTKAQSAIVFAQISNSSPLSTITTSEGSWLIPLSQSRTNDLASYAQIDVSSTLVEIFVQTGLEIASAKIYPSAAKPAPPITLGEVHNFANLSENTLKENPSANLELPEEEISTPASKLNVVNTTASPNTSVVTLKSLQEGEVVTTDNPQFFGDGPPGITLTIVVQSETITDSIKVQTNGTWQWEPPSDLEPGTHSITISWRDLQGVLRTLTRTFTVSAAEGPSFESSPSGTLNPTTTPTPTPIQTPTPTPVPTQISIASPTPVPIPDSGILTPTWMLSMMGIGLSLFSLIVLLILT